MRTGQERDVAMSEGGNPEPPPGTRIKELPCTLDHAALLNRPQSLQSASSSLPSTMDLPTQDVGDGYFSSEDEHSQIEDPWGRLFPLGDSFLAQGKGTREFVRLLTR